MEQYLSAIIVEDELNSAKLLHYLLEKHCPMFVVDGIAKNVEEATELIQLKKPDVVFLDIQLEDQLVFKLFESKLPKFQIIFTTAYNEYAIKAFKYDTVDYLLKPINITELKNAVNKVAIKKSEGMYIESQVIERIQNTIRREIVEEERMIAIASPKETLIIKESDIIFCSSQGKYTIFKLTNEKECVSSKNIGEYQKVLSPSKFFRIHHSYIINLSHLVKISKTKGNYCELSNGKSLPLAQRRKEELKKILEI